METEITMAWKEISSGLEEALPNPPNSSPEASTKSKETINKAEKFGKLNIGLPGGARKQMANIVVERIHLLTQ